MWQDPNLAFASDALIDQHESCTGESDLDTVEYDESCAATCFGWDLEGYPCTMIAVYLTFNASATILEDLAIVQWIYWCQFPRFLLHKGIINPRT